MVGRLDLDAFEACAGEFDASVEALPSIDHFCSSSSWILPFHRAFVPDRELHLYRRDDNFVALAGQWHVNIGPYFEPLETMWQFACPFAGPRGVELLVDVEAEIAKEHQRKNVTLVLSGIPLSGPLVGALASALGSSHALRIVDTTTRFVASLAGGLDGWHSRRSASFRRNLRAAKRRAEAAGIEFVHVDVPDAAAAQRSYSRIMRIERLGWKAIAGNGVNRGEMRAFYREMLPRLASRGQLRLLIARLDGCDVGYLHGGALAKNFRGLQMSFDDSLRHLSLGNLLQYEMIRTICEEGFDTYDLGSNPGYKERWSEPGLRTGTLLCVPTDRILT